MKERILKSGRRLFTPPVFANDEKTRAVSQIYEILWIQILSVIVIGIVLSVLVPVFVWYWLALIFSMIVISLALLYLAKHGLIFLSSFLLVAELWTILTIFACMEVGVGTRSAWGFFIVVFIAGMLLGKIAAIISAGICSLTTLAIAFLSPMPSPHPLQFWLTNTMYLVFVILLQFLASRSIRELLAKTGSELRQRLLAQAALFDSEKKHREMVNFLPFCVFEADLSGRLTFVNQTALEWFGYCENEFLAGMNVFQILVDGDGDRARENLGHLLSGQDLSYREYQVQRKDGSVFTVLIRSRLVEEGGKPVAVQGSLIDISERKQAEREREHSISLLKATLESTDDGILVVDLTGKITHFNQRFVQMWQIPDKILTLGEDAQALTFVCNQLSDPQGFVDRVQKLYTDSQAESFDLLEFKDGRYFERYSQPQLLGGQPVGRVWSFRDISARKRAEKEISAWKQRFENVTVASNQIVYDYDFVTGNIQWSGSIENVLGYQLSEMNGGLVRWEELIAPQDRDEAMRLLDISVKDGTPYQVEYGFMHKNGRFVKIFDRGLVMQNAAGKPERMIGMMQDITERKQAEEALLVRNQFVSSLLRAIPVAVFFKDKDGKYTGCNDAYTEIMGVTSEELEGKTVHDIWPGELAETYHQKDLELIKERKHQVYEFQVKDKHGQYHPVIFAKDVFLDANGEVGGMVGAFLDITARKQAEQALQESEEKYRQTMNVAPIGIYVIQDMLFKFVNPEMARLHGYEPEEMIDTFGPPDALVVSEHREMVRQTLLHRQAGVRGKPYEIKAVRKDGSTFDALVWGQGIVYHGRPASVGTLIDISERKHAEAALTESEHRYRTLFDTAGDSIFVMKDNLFFDCNSKTLEMFGCQREQIIGVSPDRFSPLLQPDGRKSQEKALEKIKAAYSGIPQSFEWLHSKADGTPFMADVSLSRFELASTPYLLAIVRNTADRKMLEEQLRQAQKMEAVGILAGGIAHDFNNILSTIVGYASLLQMQAGLDKKLKEYLERILASTERAASLTHSLLAFSRKQAIELQPVDINDAIFGFHKVLGRLIGEDIDFQLKLASENLVVDADIRQIEQVLMNLATNSRDAMPHGGMLTITTRSVVLTDGRGEIPNGSYAVISVFDSGTGMDSEIQSHLFEPFYTTKEVGKGTGLGLAIVYGIVKNHQGFIKLESHSAQGTTFHIYLPLNQLAIRKDRRKLQPKIPRGTETILLVEDDAAVRHVTKSMLEEFGYTVLEAADGQKALALFAQHRNQVRLLLSDLIMPKKNGRETRAGIMKLKPDIKTIFMSGYTSDIIARKGILEPGTHLLLKPLHPAELLKKIREVLDS